jgi:DNA methylase
MYPLDFPLRVLKGARNSGSWVLDPFCGRGTTNFAARLLGMPSIGIDSSPVAAALAEAKLLHASPADVVASAIEILAAIKQPHDVPTGEFWELAYHEKTLHELCRLREGLLADCSSSSRILLRAIVLGALHGPRPKGKPSYFSNQSPRTFAPKPKYAVKFWTERNLCPEAVDVLAIVRVRAERYLTVAAPSVDGRVRLGDSRQPGTFSGMPKFSWIVTSPPYYGMRTYVPDQWLRNWFMGAANHVEYRYSETQIEHTGASHFSREMGRVWENLAGNSASDARLIIRFGGIHDRNAEPMGILRSSLSNSGWKIVTTKLIPDADTGRRQVRQFQSNPRKCITEHDVYCRLS